MLGKPLNISAVRLVYRTVTPSHTSAPKEESLRELEVEGEAVATRNRFFCILKVISKYNFIICFGFFFISPYFYEY